MKDRLLGLLSYAALPYVAFRAAIDPAFRHSLNERRGLGKWDAEGLSAGSTVWLHGASVGEVGGLFPLIHALRTERPDLHFLVSTTSLTGQAEVKRREPDVTTLLLPLDLPGIVRKTIARVHPSLVIIAETELWPNFLLELKRKNVPVVLVNGRISDYSFPKYRRFRFFFRPLLESIAKLLVQTHLDAERFVALGAQRENVMVCGSTKYSSIVPEKASEEERATLAATYCMDPTRPCFVAGSIRPGEEEIIVDAYREVRRQYPDLQCVLAPRHMDRVEPICRLLEEAELEFLRRSEIEPRHCEVRMNRVIVLDTIGELRNVYALATLAFVGGSLVDFGGHNPLEPAALGVPIIFGPYDRNVRDAVWQLRQAGGLTTVTVEEDIIQVIKKMLHSGSQREEQGKAARRVAEQNSRAIEQVMPILRNFLPPIETRARVNSH